jgi:ABC-type transport system substrate-binding protein
MEVNPSDVLDIKGRHPQMMMLKAPGLDTSAGVLSFSQKPDSPFKDERIRRALSMTLERDLLIDTFFELEKFRNAGIPLDKFWNSHINAAHPEWVDPKGTGLGEGAKYFKNDLAEAKKLIEAAGMKAPVAADYSYFTDRPTPDVKQNEVMMAMMNESKLFNMKPDTLLYDSSWRAAEESKGEGYNGILWNVSSSTSADSNLVQIYTPTGRGAIRGTPIPKVQDLILKQRAEGDVKKRTEIIKQIQQEMALQWPAIMIPGQAPQLTLHWPWLRNVNIFNEGDPTSKQITRWWYDPTKRKA